MFLLFTTVSAHARETCRFLPCFGKDVRGVERHAADGHFYSDLPAQAWRLMELKGDALDDGRRKALKSVAELCGMQSTVPFMGLMMKMAEKRVESRFLKKVVRNQ